MFVDLLTLTIQLSGPFASLDGPSDRLGPGAPAEISAPGHSLAPAKNCSNSAGARTDLGILGQGVEGLTRGVGKFLLLNAHSTYFVCRVSFSRLKIRNVRYSMCDFS